ncbi:MAG: hypothetical protein WD079_07900 [Phycisphaeraceae bacterium]
MNSVLLAISSNVWDVVTWTVVFLVLLVVGFVAVAAVRKHFREDDAPSVGGMGFTLNQLRQMRRDGEINDEQYEKLRQHIIGSVAAKTADPKPDKPARPPSPEGRNGDPDDGPQDRDRGGPDN